jgi:hypothetical protein
VRDKVHARWLLAAVPLFLACGKDHHAQGASVSAAEFPERMGVAMSSWDQRCCEQAGLTVDDQSARYAAVWHAEGAHRKFDAAAAGKCLDALETSSCLSQKSATALPEPCRKAIVGTIALGEACATSLDCAPSGRTDRYNICIGGPKGAPSVCTRVDRRSAGQSCGQPVDEVWSECTPPLLCDTEREICVRRAKLGEPCLTGPLWGDTCDVGLVCDRNGSKRCVKPTPVGGPCTSVDECENLACVEGVCREPLFIVPLCSAG